jgi:hypothetical protein
MEYCVRFRFMREWKLLLSQDVKMIYLFNEITAMKSCYKANLN